MRILGISPLDKDSTVSLLEDGHVLFACGEERLSREKLQDGFPHRALQLALSGAAGRPTRSTLSPIPSSKPRRKRG
jgi:predicted NodU family carbamoyl transferase